MMEIPEPITLVFDQAIQMVYSFEPLAAKTVVLVPDVLKAQVGVAADAIGMDVETVSYVFGLLVCYPLGLIMAQIPFGMARHLFSFLLGAFLLQFTLGSQWIHQLISSLVAYAMIVVLPRKTLKTVLPVFAMLYMTAGHLHRQYVNYLGWDLDFTGCQMVLTMKLYMIAYNLYDGELLAKGIDNRAAKKCAAYALKDKPNLLEFLGYTFCFSNLLAGPASEFSVYEQACNGSIFKMKDGSYKRPDNLFATIRPLLESFVAMGAFLYLGGQFPLLDPTDPQHNTPAILTATFLQKPFLARYFHAWMGLLGVRQKYYFGWKNAEGAQNVWYAGFDGWDENGKAIGWETSSNVDIIGFELASDVQNMSKNWNKKTSFWLTRYVYIRTGGSLLAVYSMSAFWHGFYPGYYIFFLSVPIATLCDRLAKKKISPYIPPSSSFYPIYCAMGTLATTVTINYMILPFVLLAGSWSIEAYKSFFFFGHVGSIIAFGLLSVLPSPKKDKKKTA
ncbi:membrane-bound O-acyltransferase family protein [Nitzschia inconspicua]|uniref:Membrane-bound O-acyltransferase family protein n=1 Tax=Nitzschia inconspicua TaxID=303405 RepID=A0A9K3KZU7_9STRA|nr:membrane-bound O-acyltransferase family protein [Nitzschia inconspicua]